MTLSVLVALLPSTAGAAPADQQLASADPYNWTPWVNDGRVQAVVRVGDTVVVGGTFTTIQQNATSPVQSRPYLFAYNALTGQILPGFAAVPNGEVKTIIPNAAGTAVYVGGSFSQINGKGPARLALLDLATGNRVSTFKNPALNSSVFDLRLVGSRLLVAGSFTTVGGVARGGLASLDANTGALDSYLTLSASGQNNGGTTTIRKIDVTPSGSRMVGIGNFTAIDGQQRLQIFMADLGPTAATLADWSTLRFPNNCSTSFDTYMRDATAPNTALIKVSGGPTYDHRWVGNSYGKFALGFDYDKTGGQATTMRAVKEHCTNQDSLWGRAMDADRQAPNNTNHEWNY